jgi:sulfotransferase family protein
MLPSFLVIGGQKCGTSWLQYNLSQHPQVWLPPIKEVHYFDHGDMPLLRRLCSSSKRVRKARLYALSQFRAYATGETNQLAWSLRYWLARRDDDWYCGLFPSLPNKVTGEICPGYARLREPTVRNVKRLLPDARIVYLLRNPIERSWSYAAQYFTSARAKGHYGRLSNVPPDVLKAFLEKDAQGHSNYVAALEAWQPHFGSQLLLGFFDELQNAPDKLFQRVARFLDIDAEIVPSSIRENMNRSRDSKITDEYRAYLARLHLNGLHKLHDRLQTLETASWLREAEIAAA